MSDENVLKTTTGEPIEIGSITLNGENLLVLSVGDDPTWDGHQYSITLDLKTADKLGLDLQRASKLRHIERDERRFCTAEVPMTGGDIYIEDGHGPLCSKCKAAVEEHWLK